jgi:hypothetical protein
MIDDHLAIEVLLKEYETLRAEILQRIQARFQLIALAGALCGFLTAEADLPNASKWAALVAGLMWLGCVWFWFDRILCELARHMYKIEEAMNQRIRAELMTWEHRKGGYQDRWYCRFLRWIITGLGLVAAVFSALGVVAAVKNW